MDAGCANFNHSPLSQFRIGRTDSSIDDSIRYSVGFVSLRNTKLPWIQICQFDPILSNEQKKKNQEFTENVIKFTYDRIDSDSSESAYVNGSFK